jgi:glutamine synthetase adenylyltransferase
LSGSKNQGGIEMTKISLAAKKKVRLKKNAAGASGKKPDVDATKSNAKRSTEAMNGERAPEPTKDSKRTIRRMLRKVAKSAAVDSLKGASTAGMDVQKLSRLATRAAVAAVRALQDASEIKGNAGDSEADPA